MNIGSWEYGPDDFRLDKLGNELFIVSMADLKLAFSRSHLIGFARTGRRMHRKPYGTGSEWVVKQNHWSSHSGGERDREEEHLQALQGTKWNKAEMAASDWDTKQIYLGDRLETIEFYAALRNEIENPEVLLRLVANEAQESLDGL